MKLEKKPRNVSFSASAKVGEVHEEKEGAEELKGDH